MQIGHYDTPSSVEKNSKIICCSKLLADLRILSDDASYDATVGILHDVHSFLRRVVASSVGGVPCLYAGRGFAKSVDGYGVGFGNVDRHGIGTILVGERTPSGEVF